MTPQERLDSGILPGMLRLSIGLEGEQALFDDLRRALRATV
jgi:methionine-gamma-lyase